VGRRHAQIVADHAVLVAIADPAPVGQEVAVSLDVPVFDDLQSLLDGSDVDGVIIATPNQHHEADALTCIEHGIAVLVEKPISGDAASGERIVTAAEQSGVPLLVGHHRRYNPIVDVARTAIEAGHLGRIVSVNAICWLYKPDPYFDVEWRRKPGAGPVFINLIHDVELLLHLCGPVVRVQAAESSAARSNEVEDTASAILTFESGALGTVAVSDAVASPWSWELTAAENPAYPETGQSAYLIGGSEGSLSIPDLRLWRHGGTPDWMTPIRNEILKARTLDPLVQQVLHFADVATGQSRPHVDGRAGLAALRVIEAVKQAAATGLAVAMPPHV
jgi:predicted dehydrogenase